MGRANLLRAATACTLAACLLGPAPQAAALRPTALPGCTASSPAFTGTPWPVQHLPPDRLWRHTRGAGVRVAVIDTGVDARHPQLAHAVDVSAGVSLLRRGVPGDAATDPHGHGTMVAGVIAARPSRGTGVTGIAPEATLLPVRQHDGRRGDADLLAEAVDHAVSAGADVITVAQETVRPPSPGSPLERAVARAVAADVVVVASAGNAGATESTHGPVYPAAYPGVLAVAASDVNDAAAPSSRSGDFVDVAAPGVGIVSTAPGSGHCTADGTSYAAPYVAGLAALLRARHPRWSAPQVAARILRTARRTVPGRDDRLGWGVADPLRALAAGGARTDPPGVPRDAGLPEPVVLRRGETAQERGVRVGTYALLGGGVAVACAAGAGGLLRNRGRGGVRPAPTVTVRR